MERFPPLGKSRGPPRLLSAPKRKGLYFVTDKRVPSINRTHANFFFSHTPTRTQRFTLPSPTVRMRRLYSPRANILHAHPTLSCNRLGTGTDCSFHLKLLRSEPKLSSSRLGWEFLWRFAKEKKTHPLDFNPPEGCGAAAGKHHSHPLWGGFLSIRGNIASESLFNFTAATPRLAAFREGGNISSINATHFEKSAEVEVWALFNLDGVIVVYSHLCEGRSGQI